MSSEELQVCLELFREIDTNGSCSWKNFPRKITNSYYFNNEKINIKAVYKHLNHFVVNFGILH